MRKNLMRAAPPNLGAEFVFRAIERSTVCGAPEPDEWYSLMVENPANGQISVISTQVIDLDGSGGEEERQSNTDSADTPRLSKS